MANHNFLEVCGIGSDFGEQNGSGMGWGQAQFGASPLSYRHNFIIVYVFCLLMQPIIILLPLSNCSICNKCDIHIKR